MVRFLVLHTETEAEAQVVTNHLNRLALRPSLDTTSTVHGDQPPTPGVLEHGLESNHWNLYPFWPGSQPSIANPSEWSARQSPA